MSAQHRYRIEVEFDGTPFVGWQRQDNGPSVQGAIEEAAARLTQAPGACYGAGRTDSGVHAIAMTAHLDLAKALPADNVRDGLNAHLRPAPVSILLAQPVSPDFHARFQCHRRHYLYRLLDRRSPPVLMRDRVWHVIAPLDVDAMAKAAQPLIGQHDFTTYRSAHCQAESPVKTLSQFEVTRVGQEVHCALSAPSFLHNQVRSLVGTLVQVGLGRAALSQPYDALQACDRRACGPVAPAHGLYFVKADYPPTAI